MKNILIIGATGNIGSATVDYLVKQQDIKLVIGTHNIDKTKIFFDKYNNIEYRLFDFLSPNTFSMALENIDKVFFVRPPQLSKPKVDMFPFLEALQDYNIKHVVFVSLLGVEKNPMTPHHKIEKKIEKLKLPYTFIRPSFFMQNLNTTHLQDITEHNDLFVPAGKSKTSFVDTRDVGEVAAHCLLEEQYIFKKLDITGEKALTYCEVANIMSNVLNRPITYSKPGLLRFRKVMIERGTSKDYANVMTILYLITQLGNAKTITTTAKKVLKRPPFTFEEYVERHKEEFSKTK